MIGELRIVAVLKRIAKALEERNRIERERMEQEAPPIKVTKRFQIAHPTAEQWSDNWRGKHGGIE